MEGSKRALLWLGYGCLKESHLPLEIALPFMNLFVLG
jgi:hypothetical protein